MLAATWSSLVVKVTIAAENRQQMQAAHVLLPLKTGREIGSKLCLLLLQVAKGWRLLTVGLYGA